MTSLAARNPQASAAASANSFQRYIVFVTGIDATKAGLKGNDPRGLAQTVDTFGKHRQIGVSAVVGSGTYPQVGETWVVDQSLGSWTFLSKQVAITPNVVDFMTLAQALDQLGLVEYGGPVKPPPVTTGTTVQSFVDATGDVWVAKAGVNNGAWKRARDVLHAYWYRNAGTNTSPSSAVFLHDTTGGVVGSQDSYSLYNSATGTFNPPITGWWQIYHQIGGIATASGQWLQAVLRNGGGVAMGGGEAHSSSANLISAGATWRGHLPAGYGVVTFNQSSAAMAVQTGWFWTFLHIDYLGTG